MIPPKIEEYITLNTSPDSGLLQRLYRETHLKTVYPRMLSGPALGQFLRMISMMKKPYRILEVGTFTGYSTICLAAGLTENGKIHTIETEHEFQDIFLKYFREAKIEEKVEIHIGKAAEIIPTIYENFDLIFLDADKENYLKYYQLLLPKLHDEGVLLADNVLWSGKVLDENPDKETKGIIAFNEFVRRDNRVDNVMLSIRDGVTMIRKKSEKQKKEF